MDADGKQIKEVYAVYGLAMYQAQCLERQIAISLASVFGPQNITPGQYDLLLADNFDKTMGQLLHELFKKSGADDRVSRLKAGLMQAKDSRNLLAHRYFWERASQFLSPTGRDAMLNELEGFIELFEGVDADLTEATLEWATRHGIMESDVQKIFDELLARARQN